MTITVSTDGSALGNPNGPMGWAWADHAVNAARTDGHQHDGDSDAGGATNGTNQIGELCAVLEALRAHRGAEPLTIETDSQYAINCSTNWVKGWKKNGWKNSQKKPVKNASLIKAIDAEIGRREGPVKFVWVKGHNGNPGNEKVDDLAHTYSGDARSGLKDGYLPLEGWQSLLASPYAKGVDIPADAKMLIDGKITEEQYHLGRGVESGDGDSDDWDNANDNENPTTHSSRDGGDAEDSDNPTSRSSRNGENNSNTDKKQIANGEETGPTGVAIPRKPTLTERLAEPEGVPKYDFSPRKPIVTHHRAAENDGPPDGDNAHDGNEEEPHTAGRTVRSHPDFSASPVGDDVTIPADKSDAAATQTELPVAEPNSKPKQSVGDTSSGTEQPLSEDVFDAEQSAANAAAATRQSSGDIPSGAYVDGDETDDTDVTPNGRHGNDIDDHDAGNGATNEASDHSEDTSKSEQTNDSATTSTAQETPEIPDKHESQHNTETPTNPEPAYLPSGLSVSGPLRFSPAPQTSPTYSGRPRHIRGVIAIDGYVAGDGTIVLSNAPFLIANNNHKK